MAIAVPTTDLYIHLPFCVRKCDYCAFLSIPGADRTLRGRFLDRLEAELAAIAPRCAPLETIYLGGGTPTHFAPGELARLMSDIDRHFELAPDCEFTCEGNPVSLTRDKITILQEGGVNRFSIGIQSFSRETRDAIGRDGDNDRVYTAFDNLRDSGVRSINCDIIYGVTGQTLAACESDIREVARMQPDHVSAYTLMIEPGTTLSDQGVIERDDDEIVAMWTLIGDVLDAECGMTRYEISNHAGPGHRCEHNYRIWKGRRFLGAGPSACWFDDDGRWQNARDLDAWFKHEPPSLDALSAEARAAEILAMGLRTIDGWRRDEFQDITGYDFFELRTPQIEALTADGLLIFDDNCLHATEHGLLFANHIGRELL